MIVVVDIIIPMIITLNPILKDGFQLVPIARTYIGYVKNLQC